MPILLPKEGYKLGHHLIRRFVDQPVARALDDNALDIISDEAALCDQEFARSFFAGKDEHWHLQCGLGEGGEVLGILLEGAEHLETCSHGVWLCICRCIELSILLGNGSGRIGREVVPEVLEVDALATINERQWRLAVKMEMPEIPEQPDARPIADTRKKSVHQRNPLHFTRELCGVSISDHQADIVPRNADALVPKGRRESVNVLRHRLLS